ncbi:MAG: CBS domain-containing protein, partial [Methanothrix sp.]
MYCKVSELSVLPDSTIREAIACIDKHYRGIVLVTDRQGNLLGTITDGDIRRAMLSGRELQDTVNLLLSSKTGTHYSKPVTARIGDDEADILRLMQEHVVHQVPLIDENGHVADLVTIQDLLPGKFQSVQAVIMAGGAVSRLHPLTDDLPKPMLPIGGRPLLELTIAQLRRAGINHVNLTTHYKSDVIMKHFGDGKEFGVDIDYLDEHEPQGTVGALRMLEKTDEPVLVMNGDVLTRVDFRAMLEFHREQQADMTVAVRMHEFRIPYGVIESTGDLIRSVSEKPVIRRMINAGIYLLNPDLLKLIPEDGPYAMTDLINRLSAEGRRVISFPIHEYWLDIKEYEDYQRVLTDVKNGVFGDLSTITMRSEPGAPVPAGFIPLCVPELAGNEWAYIKECLDTNWVSSVGPFVDHFEKMVAEYAGLKYGISANSGTASLHIALLVAG